MFAIPFHGIDSHFQEADIMSGHVATQKWMFSMQNNNNNNESDGTQRKYVCQIEKRVEWNQFYHCRDRVACVLRSSTPSIENTYILKRIFFTYARFNFVLSK